MPLKKMIFYRPIAFFLAACLAFNAATIRARPSGLNPPFFFGALAGAVDDPALFAHRAFCEAAMRARTSGDLLPLPPPFAGEDDAVAGADAMDEPPTMLESSASRLWIFSAMVMASLSWVMVGISGGIQRPKGNVSP